MLIPDNLKPDDRQLFETLQTSAHLMSWAIVTWQKQGYFPSEATGMLREHCRVILALLVRAED